jgi:hypothetical protein
VDGGGGGVTYVDATQVDNLRWHAVDDKFAAGAGLPSNQVCAFRVIFFSVGFTLQLTEANPLRKPNGTTADGSRNPFAQDNPNNKLSHKSESFFIKAGAAETGKSLSVNVFPCHKY